MLDSANRSELWRSGLGLLRPVSGSHPGLLSGVAFTGINRDPVGGLLTALEVSELDLRRVDWVVLSACDTGRGRVAGGEGVLGLQRSFQVAGARTVVASLWPVNDRATQKMMGRLYQNLWDPERPLVSRVEALRQAQLWMLSEGAKQGVVRSEEIDRGVVRPDHPDQKGRLPPYYWAGFVLSGDWR